MSKETHGKCIAVYSMENESGYTICVGYDPYPQDDVPEVDTIKICRYNKGDETWDVDHITPEEARNLGIGLINVSFLSKLGDLKNDQREYIQRLLNGRARAKVKVDG